MRMADCCSEKRLAARGLCRTCYNRAWRSGNLESHKTLERPWSLADPERYKAHRREQYRLSKGRIKRRERARIWSKTLDFTWSNYGALLKAQGGVCALCWGPGSAKRAFDVDHDHETGKVRGLLCNNCNRALGHFQDDPSVCRRAANYLEGRP